MKVIYVDHLFNASCGSTGILSKYLINFNFNGILFFNSEDVNKVLITVTVLIPWL